MRASIWGVQEGINKRWLYQSLAGQCMSGLCQQMGHSLLPAETSANCVEQTEGITK